jgi:hypothetical protein
MSTIDRQSFPCWACKDPAAIDAKHWLGSCSEEDLARQMTPSGNIMGCCRVQLAGVVPASMSAPARPTRARRW